MKNPDGSYRRATIEEMVAYQEEVRRKKRTNSGKQAKEARKPDEIR